MGQQKAPPLVMTHQRGQEQTCDDQAGTKDIIPFPPVGRKSKGGIFMKVHIDLPWGGVLDIEIQPVDPYKFYNLVWGIVLCVIATSFFGIRK